MGLEWKSLCLASPGPPSTAAHYFRMDVFKTSLRTHAFVSDFFCSLDREGVFFALSLLIPAELSATCPGILLSQNADVIGWVAFLKLTYYQES